jgi:hypothetical protein
MDRLHKYLVSLVENRFFGSVKINFEDGVPVLIREEKSIDTAPFKEEIKEKLKRVSSAKKQLT